MFVVNVMEVQVVTPEDPTAVHPRRADDAVSCQARHVRSWGGRQYPSVDKGVRKILFLF